MIDVGIGASREKNTALAADEALRIAKKNKKSGKNDLAILFSSADIPAGALIKQLSKGVDCPLIGLNGAAVFTRDGAFDHGIALMLLGFPENIYCTSAYLKDIKNSAVLDAGLQLSERLLYGFKNTPRTLGLVMFDRLIENGEDFISGIQERLGKSFPCVGASSSDGLSSLKTSLFFNGSSLENACCGMLWGGKITYGLGTQHGWKPLGKPHTVTEAHGNIVSAIDGFPAVRLYEEYLSYTQESLKKEIKRFSVFYPIGINIPGEEEYLLRNVIMVDDSGSLHCQGSVPQGATIRVMISTRETCLQATEAAVRGAQKQLESSVIRYHKEKTAKFAIAFSSVSRYTLLRKEAAREIEIAKQYLGDTPIIGLYTTSELAPLQASTYHGQLYFHNQTFSILLIEG